VKESPSPFEILNPGIFGAAYLAEVVAVKDEEGLNRVQVRLYGFDGVDRQDAPLWARVAVPFAGSNRGAFMLPDVGDEVLISFINGDARFPVVVGGLWNGRDAAPETLGGDGAAIDRWTIVGKNGTRIAIVEESSGREKIELSTPGGVTGLFTDEGGGKIKLEAAGSTVTIDPSGIKLDTPSKVTVNASTVQVTAGMVNVDSAMSKFSGVVKCDVLITNSVISTSYTPGAGNIW
jgi:uncharacterized protein involved in type VI secretion and phage assembly